MNLLYLIPMMMLMACKVDPEPIDFGKDACDHCKMVIMDPKFGAEIITEKGRIYKFDDVNCKINYIDENNIAEENLTYNLVIDFSEPQTLINADRAYYVKSEEIKSPMGSQIAAFNSEDAAQKMIKRWKGSETLNYFQMKASMD
jgi:copper chaperone NosL